MMVDPIYTYVIETEEGEFYCGKTNNIDKRLKEHMLEKRPHWFGFKDRKKIHSLISFKGNHEKKIKTFGVKRLMRMIETKHRVLYRIRLKGGLPS